MPFSSAMLAYSDQLTPKYVSSVSSKQLYGGLVLDSDKFSEKWENTRQYTQHRASSLVPSLEIDHDRPLLDHLRAL